MQKPEYGEVKYTPSTQKSKAPHGPGKRIKLMTQNLRDHSRLATTGVKTLAAAARQTVGDQLRIIKESLPNDFQKLPTAERREMLEELRAGLNTWASELDPLLREFRSLLRELQDAAWS